MSIDTLYGVLDLPDWKGDLIILALRELGEWGAVEAAIVSKLLPDGAILWDCGAFLGTFSLGVAQLSLLSSIVAVEANPVLVPYLRSNLERLAPCPSIIVDGGIGEHNGYLTVKAQEEDNNRGAQEYTSTHSPPASDAIPCHTLGTLREKHGNYDALKLDIEGMEVDAIRGDRDYLRREKPVLWVECNENLESLHIFSAIKALGHDLVYVAFPAFRPDNHNGSDFILYPFAYEAALFAASSDVLAGVDWSAAEFADAIVRPVRSKQELRRAMFDTPRWGKKEWLQLSRIELVAQLTRILRGEKIGSFLR